jgi:hypothetical protein
MLDHPAAATAGSEGPESRVELLHGRLDESGAETYADWSGGQETVEPLPQITVGTAVTTRNRW